MIEHRYFFNLKEFEENYETQKKLYRDSSEWDMLSKLDFQGFLLKTMDTLKKEKEGSSFEYIKIIQGQEGHDLKWVEVYAVYNGKETYLDDASDSLNSYYNFIKDKELIFKSKESLKFYDNACFQLIPYEFVQNWIKKKQEHEIKNSINSTPSIVKPRF